MPGLTQQQQEATTTQARRILVSAGAGSGKTHVLVERFIERLKCDPKLSISQLIAVTFTRKAASEMRIRLKTRLRELHEQSTGSERERWALCVCQIDGARIGTIHSLCESIIRTFPLDAQVDPQLDVLDDLTQATLIKESIDQTFREAIGEQSVEHDVLLEFDLEQVRRWLTSAIKAAPQFQEAVASMKERSVDELKVHAQDVLRRARDRALRAIASQPAWRNAVFDLERSSPGEMTQTLDQFRRSAHALATEVLTAGNSVRGGSSLSEEQLSAAWRAVAELAQMKPGNTGGNKDDAKTARAAIKSLREVCADFIARVPMELNESDERAFALSRGFISLALRAQQIYGRSKRERFTADYNDLISLALNALIRRGSAARRFYNETIAEILVDEFQDTNRVQTQLLSLLAGADTTLFMIGDDKQSIYKFQGADVSVFKEWRQSIRSDNGALLSLSRSFRSHPHVVGFINSLFREILSDDDDVFNASFEALDAARAGEDGDPARVEMIVYSPPPVDSYLSRAENTRRAESRNVAGWILEKIASQAPVSEKSGKSRPIRYGDFAVLVQRNKDFAWLEQAFIQAGIPYVMLGGRNFLQRQEISDMENLLSFLSSPLDDHALLGVLRSPMFAVSDYLLHAIGAGRSDANSLWNCVCAAARQRKPGFERIRNAASTLGAFLEISGKLRLSELLRKIIERTGYDIVLLGLPNGRQRSRNLWKLAALAAENDEMSCGEFASTLRLMRELQVQKSDAALDTRDSVKLITIHSAKGLEFPAVILPVLDVSAAARSDRVVFHREYGLALNTARNEGDVKPAWYDIACSINDELELAEKKRLFYVAATRARDHLGIFLDADSRNVPSFRLWLKDWLGLENGELERDSTLCTVKYIDNGAEETSQPLEKTIDPDKAEEEPGFNKVHLQWDLIWPSMAGELSAPVADAGVRITMAASRQHLESTRAGIYFHALMENMPADLTPLTDDQLRSIAFAQGDGVADLSFFDQLVSEGKRLHDLFLSSELAARLKSARRRLHELPYMFGGSNIHTRRPDLIFQDHRGQWHIVDYKTDHVLLSDVPAVLQKHSKQLCEYVTELGTLTGLQFTAHVYFAQLGQLTEIAGLLPITQTVPANR